MDESINQTNSRHPLMPDIKCFEIPSREPDEDIIPSCKRDEKWNLSKSKNSRTICGVSRQLNIGIVRPVDILEEEVVINVEENDVDDEIDCDEVGLGAEGDREEPGSTGICFPDCGRKEEVFLEIGHENRVR